MKILITGATGFIGNAILSRLTVRGFDVVAVANPQHGLPRDTTGVRWIGVDLAKATTSDWRAHLANVDAVINCAGVFDDTALDSSAGVNTAGAIALFESAEQSLVNRVIHFSAIGVDRGALSTFSQSKLAAEEDLMRRVLDWVILRPSVVVGRGVYGASALFRALAVLPVTPELVGAGRLQVVQLNDVIDVVTYFLLAPVPRRCALDVVGPDRLSFGEIVEAYRSWFGRPQARRVRITAPAMQLFYSLGDFAALLGWRSPIRSAAKRELTRGAVGDPTDLTRITGIIPSSLSNALQREPVSVQERWFAALYLLKPVVFAVLSGFWILTGLVSLGPGYSTGVSLMTEAGAGPLAGPSVVAGAVADILIGLGIAFRKTSGTALWGAVGLTAFYIGAGTILLSRLWAEPLGPFMKVLPVLVLNFVALAILKDR